MQKEKLDNALLLQILIRLLIIHVALFIFKFLSSLTRNNLLPAFLLQLLCN